MKKTCRDCLACPVGNSYKLCELGYKLGAKYRNNVFNGQVVSDYFPLELCPKPKTNKEYVRLLKSRSLK